MQIINKRSAISRVKTLGLSAVVASAAFLGAVDVSAHGYVSSPKARVIVCKENGIENPTLPACVAAKAAGNVGFYSPQSIAIGGVKDNHQSVIADGKLCSAGVGGYGGLDLARTDWPATTVSAGPREFVWTNTAQHRSMYFRYYITKQGYNPANPLKWSDLEQIHQSAPTGQEATSRHVVTLPARTGKHVVYSIWQRDYADAPEGFYQCIDVQYGTTSSVPPTSSSTPSSRSSVSTTSSSITSDTCAALSTWNAATAYTNPQQVKFNNRRYQANYWTQGNNPELTNGQYNYWLDLGACNSNPTSSVAPSSKSSSVAPSSRSSSSTPTTGGNCSSPNYVDGATYANNALVKNAGSEYRCIVGGWCTVGGPYAPGTGWAWTNAWSLVRSCN